MRSPPTQKQIAAKLGLSQTLVSRVLAGRGEEIGASKATIRRIKELAAEWNYQPNASSLALLGVPTRTIGIVVKDFEDPFFGSLIGILQGLAREYGHSLLLSGGEERDLNALRRYAIDGIILTGSDFSPSIHGPKGLGKVQIGTGLITPGAQQIHMDEEAAVRDLVEYLTGLGHRTIGFVGHTTANHQRRLKLLQAEMAKRGLPIKEAYFETMDSRVAQVPGKRLLDGKRRPSAVVAADDTVALSFMSYAYVRGLKIPQDLSLVGVDDIPVAAQLIPALTTIRQPLKAMAEKAFSLLTEGEQPKDLQPICLRGELVVRGTCSSPNQKSYPKQ